MLAAILSLAIALSPMSPDAAKKSRALKAEADVLYRKKQYPQACAKYLESAGLDSVNASLWADLGLCFDKAGNPDSSIAMSTHALRLTSKRSLTEPGDGWSAAAAKVRKNVYFNLSKVLEMPQYYFDYEYEGSRCFTLPAAPGCGSPIHACETGSQLEPSTSSLRKNEWKTFRLAATQQGAAFSKEELAMRESFRGTGEGIVEMNVAWREVTPPASIDVRILDDDTQKRVQINCEKYASWSCSDSKAVADRTQALCPGEEAVEARPCFAKVCEKAETSPWKAVRDEEKAGWADYLACHADDEKWDGDEYECRIVHADACAGIVGVACSETHDGERSKVTIGELYLKPIP